MKKSFSINNCRIDDPNKKAFVTGKISNEYKQHEFLMTCESGINKNWKFFLKNETGRFVELQFLPVFFRTDYPAYFSVWLMGHIDQIVNSLDSMKYVTQADKIVIEYTKEICIPEEHRIEAILTNKSDMCCFSLSSHYKESWMLFVSNKAHNNMSICYGLIPRFEYNALENRTIIKWIGENTNEIIDFSNKHFGTSKNRRI